MFTRTLNIKLCSTVIVKDPHHSSHASLHYLVNISIQKRTRKSARRAQSPPGPRNDIAMFIARPPAHRPLTSVAGGRLLTNEQTNPPHTYVLLAKDVTFCRRGTTWRI